MIVIGLDPSISAFGWAVVEVGSGQPGIVDVGTWKTKIDQDAGKLADRARRIEDLGKRILRLIDAHGPACIYVEGLALGMKTGRGTAQTLGRVRGLIEGICLAREEKLFEIRPDVVKRAICGRRDASKTDVGRRLCQLFPYAPVLSADENGHDALAVAIAGETGAPIETSPNVTSYREPREPSLDEVLAAYDADDVF